MMEPDRPLKGSPANAAGPGSPGLSATVTAAASGWTWLPLSVAVIALDQLSKSWIMHHFGLYERHRLLSVLDITLMYNTGAAFSFLSTASGWQRWVFVALAFVVGAAILVWLRRLHGRSQGLLSCSLALILAGAIGNVIDRLRIGHVVDFIHAHWNDAYFPAFNVADSAITIGAALLLLEAWLESRGRRVRQ
ncbi:MAG TPA: signal peptidase II [Steroidobacteraceae bacterium]|jgi:signal peptidase II